jgi:outer membrane protein assembly factor BamB
MSKLATSILVALAATTLAATGCFPVDHYKMGMEALKLKKYPDAQHEFSLVPPNDAQFQHAQFQLGVVLYMLHDLDHALSQMIAARSLQPEQFAKEQAMVTSLGRLHAELTQRWNLKTDGEVEEVKAVGDVLVTVSKDGVLSARRGDRLMWETPLGPRGNYGHAIPVIDGTMVYIVKEKTPAQLLAIHLETGELAWSHELSARYEFSNVGVDAHAIYVGDGARKDHTLVALDKRSGRQLWATPISGSAGPIVADHDRVCTHTRENHVVCVSADGHTKLIDYPLAGQIEQTQMTMSDQSLYVATGNAIYALHFTAAPLAWKQAIEEGALSAASLVDGGSKLVVQTRLALHAYDAASGSPLWLVSSPREDGAWHSSTKQPVEVGGAIVGWGKSFVFGVAPDGKLLWQLAVDGWLSAAPISVGGDTLVLAVQGHQHQLIANAPRKLFD